MLLLDPTDVRTDGFFQPKTPIPPLLRAFGRYPNTDEWLPGDVILFGDTRRKLIGDLIERVQIRSGYSANEAMWRHAAIYIGREHVCEAVWPRVRVHPLFDAIGERYIRVRRMPGLSLSQRHDVAVSALTKLGMFYGAPEIVRLLAQHRLWRRPSGLSTRRISLICSQLCADAYAFATGMVLSTQAGLQRAATPADLALTDTLCDVDVCWRAII